MKTPHPLDNLPNPLDGLPKHDATERLKRLLDPKDAFSLVDFATFTTTVDSPKRPDNLIDMYRARPAIVADVEKRPEHYSEREREIVEAWRRKEDPVAPVTTREKNELMLKYTRRTAAEKARQEAVTRLTDPVEEPGTFENQDFGDLITIL